MKSVYMDHNATTPVRPEVLEAMLPFFRDKFGNASSIHTFGQDARAAVEEARAKVAEALGADSSEIYFTSGGTESDNMAIKGIAYASRKRGNHIITSRIEHHAVLHTCRQLEREGFEVTYVPVDRYGVVDPGDIGSSMREDTILITVMHANNETGTIQPIDEIAELAKERGVPFHTDAVQSFGKIPIDVGKLGVDLLSISGHKIYGPKGVGALYMRRGLKITPLIHGGHHERSRRAGTENVPGIVGLGVAAELAVREIEDEGRKLTELREALEGGIRERIDRVSINGHPERRLPGTSNISFASVEGESIILSLDMKGVAVSSGSACTSDSLEPSHVLMAMGVPPELAQGSVRFSLGRDNTREDVNYVLEVLPPIISRLREISVLP